MSRIPHTMNLKTTFKVTVSLQNNCSNSKKGGYLKD